MLFKDPVTFLVLALLDFCTKVLLSLKDGSIVPANIEYNLGPLKGLYPVFDKYLRISSK